MIDSSWNVQYDSLIGSDSNEFSEVIMQGNQT
jgi:hypothetical protein